MEIDFKPKYYGSMVRVSVTTVKGGIEYTIHLEDVDAIPIEWIKDYIDFGVSDKLAQHDMRFVSKMIEDWEKENG